MRGRLCRARLPQRQLGLLSRGRAPAPRLRAFGAGVGFLFGVFSLYRLSTEGAQARLWAAEQASLMMNCRHAYSICRCIVGAGHALPLCCAWRTQRGTRGRGMPRPYKYILRDIGIPISYWVSNNAERASPFPTTSRAIGREQACLFRKCLVRAGCIEATPNLDINPRPRKARSVSGAGALPLPAGGPRKTTKGVPRP